MNFKEFLKKDHALKLIKDIKISDHLKYHLDNNIAIFENIFRIESDAYFDLINEARELYFNNILLVNNEDAELLESDLGKFDYFGEEKVFLDLPIIEEELNEAEHNGKKVNLNKPQRTPGGPKKFKVYVKDGEKVKLVRFGDSKSSGLSIKNNDPARARSFRARHKCAEKKDRTTPGYWSCNVARFSKSLGLKSDRPW